jgi:hypothetical protein
MDHFGGCTTKGELISRFDEIKKQFSELKFRMKKNKSYTVTNSPCGWVTKTTGSPCLKPGFVEHNGRCQLHGKLLNTVTPERVMRISKRNPCHVTFIRADDTTIVEDAGGRVGLDLEVQGLFTDDYKQWKPEMGVSAITWMKMRPNKFSELSWKNKSSYSLVKLESPTLADYLWKKETKKLGSVICNGHIYRVKYQKFRVEGSDNYEDVIPLDGVVEG